MRLAVALILATLTGLVSAAHAEKPYLNRLQKQMLEDDKVIVSSMTPTDNSGMAAMAVAIIKAPVDKVWPVVRDCEHFHKFMPRAKRSEMRKKLSDTQMVCFLEVSMPFPLSNLHSEVLSTNSTLPGGGMRRGWTLREGNYKRNTGSWEVYPYGTAEQGWSLLVYNIDVDPDMSIPDAILRKAQAGSLPDVFKAIRKRVGA